MDLININAPKKEVKDVQSDYVKNLFAKAAPGGDGDNDSYMAKATVFEDKVPRKTKKINENTTIVTPEPDLPMYMSNAPYKETYMETDNVLRSAIMQLDMVAVDVQRDINEIRSSRTMKKKYDYITGLTASLSSVISSKISAAREMNNTIKNCHELELKRVKEMKLDQAQDDNKAVMDAYNAFISMPVSSGPINGFSSPLGPMTSDFTTMSGNLVRQAIGSDPEAGYNEYLANMTPEQRMMLLEGNNNIKQVVMYNQDTGAASFEIMDMSTRKIIPGLPKKNNIYLSPGQCTFDFANGKVRNTNINETYDLICTDSKGMENY